MRVQNLEVELGRHNELRRELPVYFAEANMIYPALERIYFVQDMGY